MELAYFAFSNGKYDETILQYLIMFYAGTTEQLYAIWKAAGDFEVPAEQLEERLLCEILFTENHVAEGCDVFVSYYHTHPGHRLIRAFSDIMAIIIWFMDRHPERRFSRLWR